MVLVFEALFARPLGEASRLIAVLPNFDRITNTSLVELADEEVFCKTGGVSKRAVVRV